MSATNRGAIRHPDDYYATPGWAVRAVLPLLVPQLPKRYMVLEPAAGEGAIVVEMLRNGIDPDRLAAVEIDQDRAVECCKAISGVRPEIEAAVNHSDFRLYAAACARDGVGFDLVLGNPPFSLAMEFVQTSLAITRPGGATVMLLRVPWLGSQERAPWLRANTPTMNLLDRRPSFYEGAPPKAQAGLFGEQVTETVEGVGTDNTEYAWFEWRLDGERRLTPPTIRILECEKSQRRRRAA